MTTLHLTEATTLPSDGYAGALCGRVWRPDVAGPSIVAMRAGGAFDISAQFATMRDLCEAPDPAAAARAAPGERLASLAEILANTPPDSARPRQALAAGAHRSPGDQGGGRHVRGFDD